MAELVHRMGGSIRKDFSGKLTHVVANSTSGEKYRVCTYFTLHNYHHISDQISDPSHRILAC